MTRTDDVLQWIGAQRQVRAASITYQPRGQLARAVATVRLSVVIAGGDPLDPVEVQGTSEHLSEAVEWAARGLADFLNRQAPGGGTVCPP